ncbi:prepilin peptidase [bacterium]|nr:MAG: prepilin peptidase [bacterium]
MTGNIILIVPFIFGAVVGSFLNVCIHRIPLGISVVSPPSRCPECKRHVPFYLNVPIISYFIIGGKCAFCRAPLSIKYPVVEALTGFFLAALFAKFGPGAELFVYFTFVSALIVITFIDLDLQIIPDVISLPGIVIGFVASFFLPWPGAVNSAIGIIGGGGVLLLVALVYLKLTGTDGMGGGDVKLLAMIGAFLGWKGALLTLFAGSLIGALAGGVVILTSGKSSKHPIPFGPFLAAGALIHLFFGDALIRWYIMKSIGH